MCVHVCVLIVDKSRQKKAELQKEREELCRATEESKIKEAEEKRR